MVQPFYVDYKKIDVCTETGLDRLEFPLVLSVPHSGKVFPQEFFALTNRTLDELRTNEDLFVDELLEPLEKNGIACLKQNVSRAFIDVNRDKIELDEKMFYDYPADKIIFENSRCRSGYGLIHRVCAGGLPIYEEPISYNEVQERIKKVYDFYHKRLNAIVNKCVQKFGFCFLLDCHSMPSKICSIMGDEKKIDICLGDLFSQSCPAEMCENLNKILLNKGYAVSKNVPYSGAYTTFNYCQPRKKIYTLQLELNRALYTTEEKLSKNSSFDKVQKDLCEAVLDFAKSLIA